MLYYRTLAQPIGTCGQLLTDYLINQGIKFSVVGDLSSELAEYGYREIDPVPHHPGALIFVYKVLIDDYELSAIMLVFSDVQLIRNRKSTDYINKIRRWFRWFM